MSYKKHPSVGGNEASLIPNKSTYSKGDIEALSKMAPQEGSFPTGTVVMCDLCGTPIAGSSISKPEEFAREMSAGRHFACHMKFMAAQEAHAKAYAGTPKWEDENLSEEERAKLYNQDDSEFTADNRTEDKAEEPPRNIFIPEPGSIPLKKIQEEGGLSAKDPKEFPASNIDDVKDEDVKNIMTEFQRAQKEAEEEYRKLYSQGDPGKAEIKEAE